MAVAAIFAAMSANGEKDMHPFFTRPSDVTPLPQGQEPYLLPSDGPFTGQGREELVQDVIEKPRRMGSKRRKVKVEATAGHSKIQKTLGDVISYKCVSDVAQEVPKSTNPTESQDALNEPHQIRQLTTQQGLAETEAQIFTLSETKKLLSPQVRIPVYDGRATDPINESLPSPLFGPLSNVDDFSDGQPTTNSSSPPKKMLRLNSHGRFSSPVSTKPQQEQGKCGTESLTRRKRGRPSNPTNQSRSLLARLSYRRDGTDQEYMAKMISRILSEEVRFPPKDKLEPKKRTPQKPKATHPFFLGKPKAEPTTQIKQSPRKASAVTPGKLRMQTYSNQAPEHEPTTNDSFGSGLFRDRLIVRHPGAKDPPFPLKEQAHVRGLDENSEKKILQGRKLRMLYGRRKHKRATVPFPIHESVVNRALTSAVPDIDPPLRADGFRDPHPLLHVPQRQLISGEQIARSVSSSLFSPISNENEVSNANPDPRLAGQAALQTLMKRIPTELTAFDEGRGEVLPWTHKYAPTTVSEVLQPTKELSILRDWLKSLTIQAVSGGVPKEPKSISKPATKPKKKRRKRNDELDDFLVDSDEDIRDMNEVSEPDERDMTGSRSAARTVVQASQKGSKSSNVVLLSGPHGCGKTATAYAVAKELGFRVFEISSSERRSGKDVIEKVGDMAENHLVKHHGAESAETSAAEEPNRIDEDFQRDLESGRQGKMNAFFKPQVTPKSIAPKKSQPEQIMKAVKAILRTQPKEQQQSLILLEEVDVLFREDKEFWTVVLKLIADSKRPFIMTCNDEDIVPIQAILLHAIFRFTHPSEDLATDYMLLVAAAEGHLLDRHAVRSLYRSKGFDLRASLTQLDFWCQMGIGDPRGGLGWIYQRWPPGCDLDGEGRQLRVVSIGTYENTMGLFLDTSDYDPDRLLQWTWTEHNVDPAVALGWFALDDYEEQHTQQAATDAHRTMDALNSFAHLADDLSTADLCCTRGLPEHAPLDTTTPSISEKARGHYVEGLRLLQTDEYIEPSHLSEQLLVNLTLSSFRIYGNLHHNSMPNAEQLLPYILSEKPKTTDAPKLDRRTFACFDPIAVPEDGAPTTGPGMLQSAFDGPLSSIAQDLAPYVRAIVQYDRALEEQRGRIDRLLSDGRKAKRARTTRAARSALEGSQRENTRKERWFTKILNYDAVLSTGGHGWMEEDLKDRTEGESPSAASTAGAE